MLDHYEEANQNSFCQFIHDGATLMNKEKNQSFAMQFGDNKFRRNNVIVLSFSSTSSHKADKVSELSEDACHECFDLNVTNVFSFSAQDLADNTASKELNADKVECDIHQSEKLVLVMLGTKDKVKL